MSKPKAILRASIGNKNAHQFWDCFIRWFSWKKTLVYINKHIINYEYINYECKMNGCIMNECKMNGCKMNEIKINVDLYACMLSCI